MTDAPLLAFGNSASLAGHLVDRPAPDPDQIGRWFQDIDTGQVYRDYGTIWCPILDAISARTPVDLNANYEWKGAHRFDITPQVHSDTNAGFVAFMYQDVGLGILTPAFHGARSLGTEENKLAVILDTLLTQLGGRGWDGAGWPSLSTGGLRVIAAENHEPGKHGTKLGLFTTPNGTDEPAVHVQISDDGKLIVDKPIVSTADEAPLQVTNEDMIEHLNAQFLGGKEASDFAEAFTPQANVPITVEAIHAALVTLGLFTE